VPIRASQIDFVNCDEIYKALKVIEGYDFEGTPSKVTVTRETHSTKLIFEFNIEDGFEGSQAIRKINSFLLDRGFKRFHCEGAVDGDKFLVSTLIVPFVVKK
jgi:hypothetical protein